MSHKDTHVFALLVHDFWQKSEQSGTTKLISDAEVVHRLVKVLRCSLHDQFIFFDRKHHGLVEIVQLSKRDLTVKILNFQVNSDRKPHIIFLLPLLKKEALEEAVYSLCELGADVIQLVVTQKSRQKLLHAKEYERLQNIVIAAAEQSKNYNYTTLHEPKKLSDIIQEPDFKAQKNSNKIVFDGVGQSFFDIRSHVPLMQDTYLLVGPEAGLTEQEMVVLKESHFTSCRLTMTTLRAVQAVAVGTGLFRTI